VTENNIDTNKIEIAFLMIELLRYINVQFHVQHKFFGLEVEQIIGTYAKWWKLLSNPFEAKISIISSILQKLCRIELLLEFMNKVLVQQSFMSDEQQSTLDIHRIFNNIPCHGMSEKLEMLLSLNQMEISEIKLKGTNMECLMTYLFWVEKTLEIQIMRRELITCIDGRLQESMFLDRSVVDTFLSSIQWIEELGMTISTNYSTFQHNLIDKEVTAEQASTWLLSKSSLPIPVTWGTEEQNRATRCMFEVASKWKAEYIKMVNTAVEQKSKKTVLDESFSNIFQLFCEKLN
jgi:hypothetical protein